MGMMSKLWQAWKNRHTLGDSNTTRELAAFLPAALEIQEAPQNPIAKWLGRSLVVLFVLIIIWACLGEVNIVASAEGKIIPSSRIKYIQPLEKAVVKDILVTEGQYVQKGQALIELDSTLTNADEQRLRHELHSMELRQAVNNGLLALLQQQTVKNPQSSQSLQPVTLDLIELPEVVDASRQDIQLHKSLLWQQWQQYYTQYQTLQSSLAKNQAEQAMTQEVVKKLQKTLPIVNQRAQKLKKLLAKNFASETEYLELEQERIETSQDLAAEKQRAKQLLAAEQEITQQTLTLVAQTQSEILTQLTDTQRQIASLQEELAKARDLNAKQVLYAPVTGQVQQLAVSTIGGVVTEAQQLMVVVPDSEKLEVEVFLENKDIGFVNEGMGAEIKIHTFPFTKYGIIDAEITNVSNDATLDEQRGLIYGMQLLMDKNTILVEGKEVKLIPGMAVTAEVQTGYRRIIEFFLAPLLRYGSEGLRER